MAKSPAPQKQLPYLSRALKRLLAERGWTAYRLAQESSVSAGVISRLLDGERTGNVAFRTVGALAGALGVSLDAFADPEKKLGKKS